MRIVFMGTPDFAVAVLEAVAAAGHEIAAVYTQPPRPAGRGKKDRPTPVGARAADMGLLVRTPLNFRDPAEREAFAALGAEAALVVAYGLILPQAVLDAPAHGCFNLHASLLPRWRGAAASASCGWRPGSTSAPWRSRRGRRSRRRTLRRRSTTGSPRWALR
jgi:methionyl-tRNA formyltransferase